MSPSCVSGAHCCADPAEPKGPPMGIPSDKGGAKPAPANLLQKHCHSLTTLLVFGGQAVDRRAVALSFHRASRHKDGPFVAIDCCRDESRLHSAAPSGAQPHRARSRSGSGARGLVWHVVPRQRRRSFERDATTLALVRPAHTLEDRWRLRVLCRFDSRPVPLSPRRRLSGNLHPRTLRRDRQDQHRSRRCRRRGVIG